jgi:hypothetical protein
MGDNLNANHSVPVVPYVIMSLLFDIMLEFLVLGMRLNATSCLDVIYSSSLLVCMISLISGFMIMLYLLFIRIKSYGYFLIYLTNLSLKFTSQHRYPKTRHHIVVSSSYKVMSCITQLVHATGICAFS